MVTCSFAHQTPKCHAVPPSANGPTRGGGMAWHCLASSGNCRCQSTNDGLPRPAPGLGALPVSGAQPQMHLPPSVSQTQMAGGIRTFLGRPACTVSLRAPPGISVSSHARAPRTLWRYGCVAHPRNRGRLRFAGAIWQSLPDAPPQKWIAWRAHTQPNRKGAPAQGVVARPGTVWHLPGPAADCQPAKLPT
jgi:hypothetical protein